jgi:predicted DNA-binding protein with PD1-like motif
MKELIEVVSMKDDIAKKRSWSCFCHATGGQIEASHINLLHLVGFLTAILSAGDKD